MSFQKKKTPGPGGFAGKLYETYKREMISILYNLLQKT